MIIIVEGARNIGKTYLLNSFFERNRDPNTIYYKFQFADYLKTFDLKDPNTSTPDAIAIRHGIHYFSIANILTIFELNQTILKDKIVVFDRCVFSAYAWSIALNRLPKEKLIGEFEKILSSDLYQNCALLHVDRGTGPFQPRAQKDAFTEHENYEKECNGLTELFTHFNHHITDSLKNNSYHTFINNHDEASVKGFYEKIQSIANPGSSSLINNKKIPGDDIQFQAF